MIHVAQLLVQLLANAASLLQAATSADDDPLNMHYLEHGCIGEMNLISADLQWGSDAQQTP
jgi:hypothetical protein